jgi:ketosteroid isomerase-like protein
MITSHEQVIRDARLASNQAIAARDADLVVSFMMPDVTVAVAHGPTLRGATASRAAFAEQFADRTFLGYVRDADTVTLNEPPVRATERGRWYGRWQRGVAPHVMRGTYTAEWEYTSMGWRISSEVFTPGA